MCQSSQAFSRLCIVVVATAAAGLAWPQVATKPYFPFATGDERVLGSDKGINFDRVTGQQRIGDKLAWKETLTGETGNTLATQFWRQDNSGTYWVGIEYEGQIATLNPPVTIPRVVTAGQTVPCSGVVTTGLLIIGTYSGELCIISTDAVASTPAGDFTQCLELDIQLTTTVPVPGGTQSIHVRQTQAPNVGAVHTVAYGESGTTEYALLFATVGGKTWGHPPVATSSYFPLAVGDQWLMKLTQTGANPMLADVTLGAPLLFHGRQGYPRRVTSPQGTYNEYWYWAENCLYLAGRSDTTGDTWFDAPRLVLRPQVYVGQVMYTAGTVWTQTGQAQSEFRVRVAQVDAVADLPAGPLDGCMVLDVQAISGQEPDQQSTRAEIWLAPHIGVVREVCYAPENTIGSSSAWAPAMRQELVWASVGGRQYGKNPELLASGYFPLQAGNWYLYRKLDGSTRTVTVGSRTIINSAEAWPFEAHEGDTVCETQWWTSDEKGTRLTRYDEANSQIIFSPPPLLLPPVLRHWDLFTSTGDVRKNGNPHGTYSFQSYALETDATVTVSAGTFEHCLVLWLTGRVGPADSPDYIDRIYTLARGIGIIKIEGKPPADPIHLSLIYARVGDMDFGPVPTAGRPGDLDGDGYVTAADARRMVEVFLGGREAYIPSADLHPYNGDPPDITPLPDGLVEAQDVRAFMRIWEALYSTDVSP